MSVTHYPVGLRARAFEWALWLTVKPIARWWPLTGVWLRAAGIPDALAGTLMPPPPGTRIEPVALQDCSAELITVPGGQRQQAILYLHGGAFITCGLRTHRRLIARILHEVRVPALSVAYRQLPHGQLADSIQDALAGYDWLRAKGFKPQDIAVIGDSAGGHLAIALALALADRGDSVPAALVAMSPWLDFDCASKLAFEKHGRDYIPAKRMPVVARMLCGGEPSTADSPVNRELRSLPPTLVQVSGTEVLSRDALLFTERAAAQGVRIDLEVWDHQVHIFQAFADVVPEGRRAIAQIGAFVRRSFGDQEDAKQSATTALRGAHMPG